MAHCIAKNSLRSQATWRSAKEVPARDLLYAASTPADPMHTARATETASPTGAGARAHQNHEKKSLSSSSVWLALSNDKM